MFSYVLLVLNYIVRESRSVLIHQLSKKLSQRVPFKTKGIPISCAFHPTRSIFFTATKKDVRVYDLLKQKLIKKLEPGVREISSIAIHPGGIFLSLSFLLSDKQQAHAYIYMYASFVRPVGISSAWHLLRYKGPILCR